MKKAIAWVVFLAVTICGLSLALPVCAQEAAEASESSIDAVILLDHSNSMSDPTKTMNDPKGYRFDATEMFISMCDLNGSRVAVIPFAGDIFSYDKSFVDISDSDVRKGKIQALKDMNRDNRTQAHTDYGLALCAAVKLLQDRTDKTNKPMIILLTDGQLEVVATTQKSSPKNAYVWNDATETFDILQTQSYTEANAKVLADTAVEKAAEYGIPIYTIALLESIADNDPDRASKEIKQSAFKGILSGYAEETDGFFTPINASNVNELPEKFGEIFAEQVGSTLLNDLTPKLIGDNQYEVTIPILNSSVQEANIFIPTQALVGVRLFNAAGKEVTGGSGDVYPFYGETFVLYKIFHPQTKGAWKLQFSLPTGMNDLSDISFSLLYNYAIQLKTSVGAETGDGPVFSDGKQSIPFFKSDILQLQARFYNPDGTLSEDLDLYKDQRVENDPETAWWIVNGTYSLLDSYNKPLYTGLLTNGYNSFDGTFDLRSAAVDSQGFNALSSGDYTLEILAEGAGLHRTEAIPITLVNSSPGIADGSGAISRAYTVDDPEHAETQAVQTFAINLYDEIADPDNDKLSFTLTPVNDAAESIVTLTLNEADGTITGRTVQDAATGMFGSGTAEYILRVKDRDPRATAMEFPVVIEVISFADHLNCNTAVDGWDPDHIAPKNAPLTFTMTLESDPASPAAIDPQEQIQYLSGKVIIKNQANDKVIDEIPMTLTPDGTLTATYTTGNRSGSFAAICSYSYTETGVTLKSQSFDFTIVNHPPEIAGAADTAVPDRISFHPLPGFLSFLEQPTGGDDLRVSLLRLITDPDNETPDYSQPEIVNGNPDDTGSPLGFAREVNLLTLIPQAEGTVLLSITGTDGDGETATFVKRIVLVDLTAKWIKIGLGALAGAIALFILFMVVRQIRKPYFPRNVEMVFMEGQAIFESDRKLLDHTKKEQKLSRYLDMVIAGRNHIPMSEADMIRIKPMRTGAGSIRIKWIKPTGAFNVELETGAVGRKYTEWAADRELTLSSVGSSERVRIVLTHTNEETFQTYQSSFDDSFNSF